MRILITGTSAGMGHETALRFLKEGHVVYGIDINECDIDDPNYTHFVADVADADSLPFIDDIEILINNAGVQNSGRDIQVNLIGLMNTTEKYGLQPCIKSILNQASVSAHTGAEFPAYAASKGGVLAYTKHIAQRVAEYGATCNSLSFGGVTTALNQPVMDDPDCWRAIMDITPLQKWASEHEAAEWIYFMTVVNRSCTGQDVIIDNGESILTHFVWKD